jgi:WD40 repeat protein
MNTKFAHWYVIVLAALMILVLPASAQTYPYTYTNMVAWSSDSQLIAVGGAVFQTATQASPILYIYNSDGSIYTNLTNTLSSYGLINALSWNSTSNKLAISIEQSVLIWDKISGNIITIPNIAPFSLKWSPISSLSPNGTLLSGLTLDKKLFLWNISQSSYQTIDTEQTDALRLIWLPTGNQIVTAGYGIRLWTVTATELIDNGRIDGQSQQFYGTSLGWRIRNNNHEIIFSGVNIDNQSQQIPVMIAYNLQTGVRTSLNFSSPPLFFELSPDGSKVANPGGNGFVYIYAVDTGQQLASYAEDRPGQTSIDIAWSPDSTKLAFGSLGTYIDIVTPPQPAAMSVTSLNLINADTDTSIQTPTPMP